MKRFTNTDKWKSPSFRQLSTKNKLLLLLIMDECDNAGAFYLDIERFSFIIGEPFTLEEVKTALGDRALYLEGNKAILKNFVRFQCGGELRETVKPHQAIINLLKSHRVYDKYLSQEI